MFQSWKSGLIFGSALFEERQQEQQHPEQHQLQQHEQHLITPP